MNALEEKINVLVEGEEVIIYSKPNLLHETQPLPEQGRFLQHRFSGCDKHPLWVEIVQPRDNRKVTMTFALANIESITILEQKGDVEL